MKESIGGHFKNSPESGDDENIRQKTNREKVLANAEKAPRLYHATDRHYEPGDIIEGFAKGVHDFDDPKVFLHDDPTPHYTVSGRIDEYEHVYEVIPVDKNGDPNRDKVKGNRRDWGGDLIADRVMVTRRVVETDKFADGIKQENQHKKYTNLRPLHKHSEKSYEKYLYDRVLDEGIANPDKEEQWNIYNDYISYIGEKRAKKELPSVYKTWDKGRGKYS